MAKVWSEEEVIYLINEVKQATYIWDVKSVHYKNKLKKVKFWEELATKLNTNFCSSIPFDAGDVARKWNNLKSYYNSEYIKSIKVKKSGESAETVENIMPWKYSQSMEFLHSTNEATCSVNNFTKKGLDDVLNNLGKPDRQFIMDEIIGVALLHNTKITEYIVKRKLKLNKKAKRFSSQWLLFREDEGFVHKLYKEIECEDSKLYRNILRMTPHQFSIVLEKVRPYITKQDTRLRNCIGPKERLLVALRYLATGETQTSMQLPFRIHQSTISKILKETIPALYKALNDEFIQFPKCESEWRSIASDFFNMWGFPNCLGAVDGKHCNIIGWKRSGSTYFNYKGFNSIILMAIADANYRFIYADVGINGRIGDAGVWVRSDLKYAIENKTVLIPPPENLPFSDISTPFTFLSDDAFALTEYMIKPYSHRNLNEKQIYFNKILSRNRRVVENAFGILANRFRVLFSPIHREPAEATKIVLACVCLHNFLRSANIVEKNSFDNLSSGEIHQINDTSYIDVPSDRRKPQKNGEKIRNSLADYFWDRRDDAFAAINN